MGLQLEIYSKIQQNREDYTRALFTNINDNLGMFAFTHNISLDFFELKITKHKQIRPHELVIILLLDDAFNEDLGLSFMVQQVKLIKSIYSDYLYTKS